MSSTTMKGSTAREKSEYAINAVTNAIRVLEALGNAEHEQSIQELADNLALTKNNTTKILGTLEMFGYIDHNTYTNNYRLGVKTFQISQAYIDKLNIEEVALPIQKELRDLVKESVYVSKLRRRDVVYLSIVETDAPVRVTSRVGNVTPAYATATGKIQLAYLESRELDQLLDEINFIKYTENTVVDRDRFMEELVKIKQLGYAIDSEEYEYGIKCIAVPIRDFMGEVIASLSVTAPVERMRDGVLIDKHLEHVMRCAAKLSAKFGYVD